MSVMMMTPREEPAAETPGTEEESIDDSEVSSAINSTPKKEVSQYPIFSIPPEDLSNISSAELTDCSKKSSDIPMSTLKRTKGRYPIYSIPPEDMTSISSITLSDKSEPSTATAQTIDELSSDWLTDVPNDDDLNKITCKAMIDGIMVGRNATPPEF